VRLSDLKIKSLKPSGKTVTFFDGHGLFLEVRPNGAKSWRLKYYVDRRDCRATLGRWPDVSLQRARELATVFRRGLADGSKKDSATATFGELASDWCDRFLVKNTPRERGRKRGLLARFVLPALRDVPAADVSARLILEKVLRPIEAAGALETVRRVRSVIGMILRYGVAAGLLERDSTRDLAGAIPAPQSHTTPTAPSRSFVIVRFLGFPA
jgi:hypothetical protein